MPDGSPALNPGNESPVLDTVLYQRGSYESASHDAACQPVTDPERLRQRAVFLRELAEARALLARAAPRRSRTAQLRARLRQSTFRF
jgi:hypothetical protein